MSKCKVCKFFNDCDYVDEIEKSYPIKDHKAKFDAEHNCPDFALNLNLITIPYTPAELQEMAEQKIAEQEGWI